MNSYLKTFGVAALGITAGIAGTLYLDRDRQELDNSHFCENGLNMATLHYGEREATASFYRLEFDLVTRDDNILYRRAYRPIATYGSTQSNYSAPEELREMFPESRITDWCDNGILSGEQTEYVP